MYNKDSNKKCTNHKYKLTILGLGNILFKDEGFGVHFISLWQQKYQCPAEILVVDGGTLGYLLMDIICGTEYLLVIDTIKAKDIPGSIYKFQAEAIPALLDFTPSVHGVEFMDILLKAELLGESPQTTFIAIVPQDIETVCIELSLPLLWALPKVEALVKEEIVKLGLVITS